MKMAASLDFAGIVGLFGMNIACSWRNCIFIKQGDGYLPLYNCL